MNGAATQRIVALKGRGIEPNYHANLLITQPPLRSMSAFLLGIDDATLKTTSSEHGPGTIILMAHSEIFCDAGITLGFLADVAQDMHGQESQRDGKVEQRGGKVALFKAIVPFRVQSDAAPRIRNTTRTVKEIII